MNLEESLDLETYTRKCLLVLKTLIDDILQNRVKYENNVSTVERPYFSEDFWKSEPILAGFLEFFDVFLQKYNKSTASTHQYHSSKIGFDYLEKLSSQLEYLLEESNTELYKKKLLEFLEEQKILRQHQSQKIRDQDRKKKIQQESSKAIRASLKNFRRPSFRLKDLGFDKLSQDRDK